MTKASLSCNAYVELTYWDGFSQQELSRFNRLNGTNWNGDLKNLTPELAAMLQADADMWQKIKETGKGGYGNRVAEQITALAEQAGVAKEQIDALNSSLTAGTTAESVYDDFLNFLYDLADGSEDVMDSIAENWQKMVNRMVINNLVGEKYRKRLEDWYKSLAKLNKERQGYDEDGKPLYGTDAEGNPIVKMTDDEYRKRLEALKAEYDGMMEEVSQDIDTFTEGGIIKPITEAVKEAFSSIKDDFKAMLSDMSTDAADFGKQLKEAMYKALLERFVMNAPITVTIDGEEQVFENLDAYLADWQERADAIINAKTEAEANMTAEEYKSQHQALEEQIREQERLIEEIKSTDHGWQMEDKIAPVQERLAQLRAQLKELEKNEVLTDEERAARMAELNAELKETLALQQQIAKTYADMAGWTMEQKIDASPLASLGDELLSALQDTSKGVEDWRKEIVEAMTNDLIKDVVYNADFEKAVRDLQEQYVNVMSSDMSAKEKAAEIQRIADDIAALYNTADEHVDGLRNIIPDIDTSPFNNLRDSFLDALTDMEGDAETFRKKLEQTLIKDLLERQVLDVPLTVTIDGEDKIFDNFDKYSEDWNKRYLEAVKNGDTVLADTLMDELMQVYDLTMEQAKALRERLNDVGSTTFSDMSDNWVSALMDMTKTADDWAENIGSIMAEQIIKQMIVPTMIQPLLNRLNDVFNSVMTSFTYTRENGENVYDWQSVLNSSELASAMSAIKEQYPQLQSLVQNIMQGLGVGNPFSDMVSTFVSSLTDMEASADDFARNISRMLVEQMIEKTIVDGYKTQINAIGKQWQEALKNGDVAEIERIKEQLVEIRKQIGDAVQPLLDSISDIEKEADTTFSSMTDSWVSALMEMEGTAEDFAQTVGKEMAQKIITEMIAPMYLQPILNAMQKAANAAFTAPGATIASVMATLKPFLWQITSVYDEVMPMVREIYDGFGIVTDIADEVQYALQDMKSNFVSSLMDMTGSAENFANDISKIMAESFVEKFVLGDAFDARMKQWQEQYESILGSGMSEDERKKQLKSLRDAIAGAREDYANQAAAVMDLFGLTASSQQDATMNMSDKITYDQADQLLGVNLAQELTLEQILSTLKGAPLNYTPVFDSLTGGTAFNDEQGRLMTYTLQTIADVSRANGDNILTQVAIANSHLQMIRDYNKRMCDEVTLHLGSINSKLSKLREL